MKALSLILITAYGMLLADYSDNSKTGKGSLAEGQERTSVQVESLSSQTDSALEAVSAKLTTTINLTLTAGTAVLRSKIEDKYDDIDDIQERIDEIDQELESMQLACSEVTECGECTSNSKCVWCSVESTCHDGDEYGPTDGECTEYLYESCGGLGCRQYDTCDSCLKDSDCGWCLNQARCNKSSSTDYGGCDQDYFYYSQGSNDQCPSHSHSADRGRDTSEREELEAEKEVLEQEKAQLNSEIDDYDDQVESLEEEAYIAAETYIPEVQTTDDLDGLHETVDDLSQGEYDEEKDHKLTTLADAETTINDNTDVTVQNRTDTVLENEQAMEKHLTEELKESQEQKEKIKTENNNTQALINSTHQETMDGLNENGEKLDNISSQLDSMLETDTADTTTTTSTDTTTTDSTTTDTTSSEGNADTTETSGETETSEGEGEGESTDETTEETTESSEETSEAGSEETTEESSEEATDDTSEETSEDTGEETSEDTSDETTAAFLELYRSFLQ